MVSKELRADKVFLDKPLSSLAWTWDRNSRLDLVFGAGTGDFKGEMVMEVLDWLHLESLLLSSSSESLKNCIKGCVFWDDRCWISYLQWWNLYNSLIRGFGCNVACNSWKSKSLWTPLSQQEYLKNTSDGLWWISGSQSNKVAIVVGRWRCWWGHFS